MPLVQVSRAPSRQEYESVSSRLRMEEDRPDGLVLHAASETKDGSVEIVDVWQSREQMDRFVQERLFPAFEQVGVIDRVREMGPPTPYEPFHYVGT